MFGSTPAVRLTMLQAAKRGASSRPDYTDSATQIPTVKHIRPLIYYLWSFVYVGAT
jgi:hypothetical protein